MNIFENLYSRKSICYFNGENITESELKEILKAVYMSPVVRAMNHIFLPLANLIGHGDVKGYRISEVREMCEKAGFTVEKLEDQKRHRLHLVAMEKHPYPLWQKMRLWYCFFHLTE